MHSTRHSGSAPRATRHARRLTRWPCAIAAMLAIGGGGVACGGAQAQAPARVSPATFLGGKQAYLVVFRPADRWPSGATLPEQPVKDHAQYLLSLYRAGTLQFAGRFGDGSGGAMFFTAANDGAALRLIQADPAVAADVFDFTLRPWMLADWEERSRSWPP